MYSIENFRPFNVRCFSDPRTFFNSELLSIYGTLKLMLTGSLKLAEMLTGSDWQPQT